MLLLLLLPLLLCLATGTPACQQEVCFLTSYRICSTCLPFEASASESLNFQVGDCAMSKPSLRLRECIGSLDI